MKNFTPATLTLSVAVVVIGKRPATLSPLPGAVRKSWEARCPGRSG